MFKMINYFVGVDYSRSLSERLGRYLKSSTGNDEEFARNVKKHGKTFFSFWRRLSRNKSDTNLDKLVSAFFSATITHDIVDRSYPAYREAGFFKNLFVPVRMLRELAKICMAQTDTNSFFERLIREDPSNPAYFAAYAGELLERKEYRKAADMALAARRLTPYDYCVSRIVNKTQKALAYNGLPPDYPLPFERNHDRFCEVPFVNLDFQTTYAADEDIVYSFCEALNWLPIAFGDDFSWNSPYVQEVRKSILDGSFRYCDEYRCPFLKAGTLPVARDITDSYLRDIIDNKKVVLDKGPRRLILSYDRSCNLSCPSCRSKVIMAKEETFRKLDCRMEKELTPLMQDVKEIQLSLTGEALASKHSMRLLRSWNPEKYPNLEVKLFTNMSLVTRKLWESLGSSADCIKSLHMSIDGATPETLEKLRRGLKWAPPLGSLGICQGITAGWKIRRHTYLLHCSKRQFQGTDANFDTGFRVLR